METTIDYDIHGHCVSCHKNMIIQQVIDSVYESLTQHKYLFEDFTFIYRAIDRAIAHCSK